MLKSKVIHQGSGWLLISKWEVIAVAPPNFDFGQTSRWFGIKMLCQRLNSDINTRASEQVIGWPTLAIIFQKPESGYPVRSPRGPLSISNKPQITISQANANTLTVIFTC